MGVAVAEGASGPPPPPLPGPSATSLPTVPAPERTSAAVRTIRPQQRKPKGLPPKNLRRLLREVHNGGIARDIAMVEVLAGTGICVGELLDLRVGDIRVGQRSGLLTVRHGKHGLYREIPLTKEIRLCLRAYLAEHPDPENPDAPLWIGLQGELRHRSSVLRLLKHYAALADIPEIGPHQLRHTFATRYLEANRDDLRGLASLLGHSSLNTVMIYTELSLDDLAHRVEQMETGHDADS